MQERLGVSVNRTSRTPEARPEAPHRLVSEVDDTYHRRYSEGLERSGTPENQRRRERFYNLVQCLAMTRSTPGLVGECGTWRGLSAYLLCCYLRDEGDAGEPFVGEDVHLFDSFEGLSEPRSEDSIDDPALREAVQQSQIKWGRFSATPEMVRSTLEAFPAVNLHAGWIPACFVEAPREGTWRFVHVDVDLYEPITDSLAFFWPRMTPGGVIVCDDYGALAYPGARQAIDRFIADIGCRSVSLSTGQAILFP